MDIVEKKELLLLLGITCDEFDNIYTLNRSFKYKKDILKKIVTILNQNYSDGPNDFSKEYLLLVALRVLIRKYNYRVIPYFSDFNDNYLVKYVEKYKELIPKTFIILLASSNRRNNQRFIYYSFLSIQEHLLYFDQDTLIKFTIYPWGEKKMYYTNIEWLKELSIKKVQNMEKFVEELVITKLITNENCNDIINVCKMYDNHKFILQLIINNNFRNEVYRIYNKSPIELINMLYINVFKTEYFVNLEKLYEIVKDDISNVCDVLYYNLIYILQNKSNIWSSHKRYSDSLLNLAITNNYYDIIIDHLNNFESSLDIDLSLSKIFKKDMSLNDEIINNIFKNCKKYDIGKILDNIHFRYSILNSDIPTLLLPFIEKVDLNMLKKFFRINCYIKDLDKFMENPYSLELYYICNNYTVYPDEYLVKFPIDKKVLEMRQFYYNNKNPKIVQKFIKYINKHNLQVDELTLANYVSIANDNKNYTELLSTIDKCIHIGNISFYPTPYVILRSCLFKSNTITDTDTAILSILAKHVF